MRVLAFFVAGLAALAMLTPSASASADASPTCAGVNTAASCVGTYTENSCSGDDCRLYVCVGIYSHASGFCSGFQYVV